MPRKASPGRNREGLHDGERSKGQNSLARFVRCSHIFSSAVREVLALEPLGESTQLPVSVSQLRLLRLMAADGHHRLGAVAGFLGVSPPAATKSIDKLENLALVFRTPSARDRRSKLLALSPKGRRLIQMVEEREAARLSPILDAAQPEEIEEFTELLERFATLLLRSGDPRSKPCLRCAAYIEEGCPVAPIRGGCPYQQSRAQDVEAGRQASTGSRRSGEPHHLSSVEETSSTRGRMQ